MHLCCLFSFSGNSFLCRLHFSCLVNIMLLCVIHMREFGGQNQEKNASISRDVCQRCEKPIEKVKPHSIISHRGKIYWRISYLTIDIWSYYDYDFISICRNNADISLNIYRTAGKRRWSWCIISCHIPHLSCTQWITLVAEWIVVLLAGYERVIIIFWFNVLKLQVTNRLLSITI